MNQSNTVVRLTRNLRYKLSYVKVFETYLKEENKPEVKELLETLIQAQQTAIAPLSRHLRRLDVNPQELELDDKLMGHASGRYDTASRLRFIYQGLHRASTWYQAQLTDREMYSDPEVRDLLFELGQIDAAKLWHTETLMRQLKISTTTKEKDIDVQAPAQDPRNDDGWTPRLVEDVGRPRWSGSSQPRWPRPRRGYREEQE